MILASGRPCRPPPPSPLMPAALLSCRRPAAPARWALRAGRRLALGMVGAAIAAVATSAIAQPDHTRPQALRDACDAASHFTVLRPEATQHEARAVWLDATRLIWPGVPAEGADHHYRLVHAVAGGLQVSAGAPVAGADAALALHAPTTPWPAALTDRFRHVAGGAAL